MEASVSMENYEIIVVDNGSCEENKAKIAAYLSDVNAKYIYQSMIRDTYI